jgi:Cu/Zn superoxide dismutase
MQKRIMMPLAIVISMLMATMSVMSVAAIHEDDGATHDFADDDFETTWNRTDLPVQEGEVERSWIWGTIYTDGMMEEYVDSPGDERLVQYFDKSRMEINDPEALNDGLWYVTNGLLVVEMVEGWYQTGDAEYDQTPDPADVNIVGDPAGEEGLGPTYADINTYGLMDLPATAAGTTITATIDGEGNISDDQEYATHGVTAGEHIVVEGIDHTVASVFWEFMTSQGTVWEDGAYVDENLFEHPVYATGYPVTEAYWTTAMVAGTERDVLWQCFERRCLTYTPGNSDGFLVEAGNVGQHYYRWRHGDDTPPPTTEEFEVQFGSLNGSGVTGTAMLSLTGNELVIDLQASGLEEGAHIWHIHGKADGTDAVCPTPDADTNGNGLIELPEGLPAYGGVIVSLPDLTADAAGMVDTSVTVTLTEEQLTKLGDLHNNVLVIHGMTVDLDGEGEGAAAFELTLPVACGDVNDVGFFDEADAFDVDINALNESGVSGTAHLELLGDLLMVDMSLTGLEAGMHPMHIHGLETGDASCPTMEMDTNGNGYIELEEGLPAYGGVLLTLGLPTTDESGTLEFSGSYIIDPAVIGDLLTRTIVVHGMTADLDGEGEGAAEYVASLPAACGDIDTPDEPEPVADAYTVMLDAQNDSGVSGSVLFTLDGDQLTVTVSATGLTPDQTHMMHLHGLETGEATCPTIDLDEDGDGFVDLDEGAVAYGGVLVPLGEPMADADGNVMFEATLTVDPETLPALTDLAVVVHGLMIDPDGEGEQPAAYDAMMPVACGTVEAGGAEATAEIMDSSDTIIGTAHLVETADGVLVHVEVTAGIAPGLHGTHIHETGTCTPPDFTLAGGHFNPTGVMHPNHAGDLGNLLVADDMTGDLFLLTDAITLGEGGNSLFDADGSAIVIHAGEDDMMSDPSGMSGARVACGVITSTADAP